MSEWQPIETAPTNESVLIYIHDARHYGEGIYRAILVDRGSEKRWHTSALLVGRDVTPEYTPTHWRALPPAPESCEIMRLRDRVTALEAGLKFYACECVPGSCENNSEPGEGDVCCGFKARALLEESK